MHRVRTSSVEEQLRTTEARLQRALRAGGIGLWEWDASTGHTLWSETMWTLYGRAFDPALEPDDVFRSALHPDDRERVLAQAHAHLHEGTGEFRHEFRIVHPDGQIRWIEAIAEVTRDEAGRAIGLSGVNIDVSARKRAEAAGRRNEALYRAMAAQLPNGAVFVLDHELRYVLADGQAFRSVGYEPEHFEGRPLHEVVSPEMVVRYEPHYRSALAGEPFCTEHEGNGRWFATHGVPLRDADGRVYAALAISFDITDRKRVEAALLDRERELQTLADNTPDILSRFDRQLRHVFINAAVEKATGRAPEEFVGKTNRELGMPPAQCDVWDAALRVVFEERRPHSLEFAFDTPDGPRWYASRFVPELGPDGEVVHALGVTHDVTDAKRAQAVLEEADRRKDEFLATLAHELRNPLAPIRNGLELLRRGTADEATVATTRDMMARQLRHLVRLVDDLLDVSRISLGKLELARERIRIQSVFEHAVETSRPLVEANRHALTVRAPGEPVWLDGDLTRLAQVVGNLLNNAAKYTPPGGHIELSAAVEDGRALVRVVDDGTGIAPDMLPRVFDLFAQGRRPLDRAQGGLGIGLSLVRKLVEMHGGTVEAQSAGLGRGSTFTVCLPLAPALVETATARSTRAQASTPARRVLVVDDNTDGAETLAMLLELAGHAATTADGGPAALEAARTHRPEVVFLDIGLPGMDGYEVARRLRAEPATANAVLVALTGWGSEDDKRKSKDAGFDVHLTKPVDLAAVADVLARVASLGRRDARDAAKTGSG